MLSFPHKKSKVKLISSYFSPVNSAIYEANLNISAQKMLISVLKRKEEASKRAKRTREAAAL